jgi:hypothetical protein
MAERKHKTVFTFVADNVTGELGDKEVTIDLSKISDDELDQLIFKIPEATSEIVYREIYGQ